MSNQAPSLGEIVDFLDKTLSTETFKDASLNGLQVDFGTSAIRRISAAVDSGVSVCEAAASSDLLIVHHGLFWGAQQRIVGPLASSLQTLADSKTALYASHLPLDGHKEYGNAAVMAHHLGLSNIESAFPYMDNNIGCTAEFSKDMTYDQVFDACMQLDSSVQYSKIQFGSKKIKRVGIATGSGSLAIPEISRLSLDLLISGEPKQECYHLCRDLELNAIFCGHYATEVFGVKKLLEILAKEFDVETSFIDIPTGF